MNQNTKDTIRLLRYNPELMADLQKDCPYPTNADVVSDWTYDNRYRLFDFGEYSKNRALAFYCNVDFHALAEWVNRKHQRAVDTTS